VFTLSDAEVSNVIRSYEKRNVSKKTKRKVYKKKKRKDLPVLAKTPQLNRFSNKTFKQQC